MYGLPSLHLLLIVAAEAQGLGRRGDQLDARDVPVHPDFMAAQASGRDRRVNRLSFALVFVALQTFGRVDILFEGNRVCLRESGGNRQNEQTRDPKYVARCHWASTW
jgi:hypothetical protein